MTNAIFGYGMSGKIGEIMLLSSRLDPSFFGMCDGREHSVSVDWDQQRRFKSPLGQIFFFSKKEWYEINMIKCLTISSPGPGAVVRRSLERVRTVRIRNVLRVRRVSGVQQARGVLPSVKVLDRPLFLFMPYFICNCFSQSAR